jgi:hypothetical protein
VFCPINIAENRKEERGKSKIRATELQSHGTTELQSQGATELQSYRATENRYLILEKGSRGEDRLMRTSYIE